MKCISFSTRFTSQLILTAVACLNIGMFGELADAQVPEPEGISSREARTQAVRAVPIRQLHPNVSEHVRDVLENPSYFRRMPTQQIACDPQMFTFLVRRPEVMVNIWEIMGITKVTAQRTSPITFVADDGVGTACKCDLIYSDGDLHIYMGNGSYEGTMSPRKVTGRCVCVLRTENRTVDAGSPNIAGTMDVFLKLDNLGADLLTRTIGPFVGKTADYNFVETAKFISQISQVCQMNPAAAQALAIRLDKVDELTRKEFVEIVTRIASHSADAESRRYGFTEEMPPSSSPSASSPRTSGLALDEQTERSAPATGLSLSPSVPSDLLSSTSQRLETVSRTPVPFAVSPMFLEPQVLPGSQSAPLANGWQVSAPAAIAPVKPNIYMRR